MTSHWFDGIPFVVSTDGSFGYFYDGLPVVGDAGASTSTMPTISAGSQVFAPALVYTQELTMAFIAAGSTLYAPVTDPLVLYFTGTVDEIYPLGGTRMLYIVRGPSPRATVRVGEDVLIDQ